MSLFSRKKISIQTPISRLIKVFGGGLLQDELLNQPCLSWIVGSTTYDVPIKFLNA